MFAILAPMSSISEHEEMDFEPEDELGAVGAAKAKMQKLRDEMEKVKAERQEYLDGWQRCKADTVNARKEALAMGEKAGRRSVESLTEDLIPALDSFDMAAGAEAWNTVDKNWRTGMEQVRSQLLEALSRAGIQRFGAAGDTCDHSIHEIIEETDDGSAESGTIVRVARSGYKTAERILRPAHVVIRK
jgi:molecular chaperone GrpE